MQNHTHIDALAEDHWLEAIPVADYPKREYSFGEIARASAILGDKISATDRLDDNVIQAFRVAHNWRMSHALPMITERRRLSFVAADGVVTAGRVKRMASIRKKLMNTNISLRDMQDLGGCRAVMSGKAGVAAVINAIFNGKYKSTPSYVSDYLSKPKPDGYRGAHVVVKFCGTGQSEPYSGQKLEIQVRTRLQHSWSTAVEIVGAVKDQDFKGGKGDPQWRQFFTLMSDYLALCDGFPIRSDGPQTHAKLCRAIREVDAEIGALDFLTAIRNEIDNYVQAPTAGPMYMLSMDAVTRQVSAVRRDGIALADETDFDEIGDQRQTVIVSVDRSADLRSAYPNFYLDVSKFTTMASRAIRQREIRYTPGARGDVPVLPRGKV